MCEWVSKIIFLLPLTPWGMRGGGMNAMNAQLAEKRAERDAKAAERTVRDFAAEDAATPSEEEGKSVILMLCVMELLSKARLLYHLFDDDAEAVEKRLHSVLPVQPQDP